MLREQKTHGQRFMVSIVLRCGMIISPRETTQSVTGNAARAEDAWTTVYGEPRARVWDSGGLVSELTCRAT
jgi:hypothetical protein